MMFRPALVLVAFCLMPALPGAQSRPAPDALARSLQQRYQGVRDFAANFVHTYRGGVLRTQTTERGNVKIKKPGRMRWVYTAPEKKEFISDGQKVYSYLPQDKQVIVSVDAVGRSGDDPGAFPDRQGRHRPRFHRRVRRDGAGRGCNAGRDHEPEADAAAVGARIRVPGGGDRSGDVSDPRA